MLAARAHHACVLVLILSVLVIVLALFRESSLELNPTRQKDKIGLDDSDVQMGESSGGPQPSILGHAIKSFGSVAEKLVSLQSGPESLAEQVVIPGADFNTEINEVLMMFWPHLSRMMEDMLQSTLLPKLHEYRMLSSLKFKSLDLQSDQPAVQILEVRKSGGRDFRMTLKAEHNLTKRIDMGLGIVSFGVVNARVSAEVVVRFDHLLDRIPLVGGIALQLADLPTIDYELSGLAALVGFPGIKGMIADAIDSVIEEQLMGPNRFAYSWSESVDIEKLRHPPPAGVLRVVAGDGTNVASALSLRSQRHGSNPDMTEVEVHLGSQRGLLSLRNVSATFMVWDEGQRVGATVWDKSPPIIVPGFFPEDAPEKHEVGGRVGIIPRIPVREALKVRRRDFPLVEDEGQSASGDLEDWLFAEPADVAGHLTLAFEMLAIVPARSGDFFILKCHVGKIMLPYGMASQSAKVIVKVGSSEAMTATGSPSLQQSSVVAEELQSVIFNMAEKKMSTSDIADILQIGADVVDRVLRGESSRDLHPSHVEVTFDSVLYLPVPIAVWEHRGSMVDIAVVPPGQRAPPIASLSREVKSLDFGDSQPHKMTMGKVQCTVSGYKYTPLDMGGQGRSNEPTPVDCQRRCARTPGCAHFSHWPADGACHLQDSDASPAQDRGATSGPPKCHGQDAYVGLSLLGTRAK